MYNAFLYGMYFALLYYGMYNGISALLYFISNAPTDPKTPTHTYTPPQSFSTSFEYPWIFDYPCFRSPETVLHPRSQIQLVAAFQLPNETAPRFSPSTGNWRCFGLEVSREHLQDSVGNIAHNVNGLFCHMQFVAVKPSVFLDWVIINSIGTLKNGLCFSLVRVTSTSLHGPTKWYFRYPLLTFWVKWTFEELEINIWDLYVYMRIFGRRG